MGSGQPLRGFRNDEQRIRVRLDRAAIYHYQIVNRRQGRDERVAVRAAGGVMRTASARAGAHGVRFGCVPARFGAVMVLALALTGCLNEGTPTLVQAQLRGPTIAFESIDGPPLPIFQKLVA